MRKTAARLCFSSRPDSLPLYRLSKDFFNKYTFVFILLRFFEIFWRYARSGFPMDCKAFHSLSLTQNKSNVPSLPLGKVCLHSHRLNEKLLRVSPRQIPLYCRLPFSCEAVPHSLQKIKGLNGRIYIKTFSNTRGKTFSINLHHAVATP